MPRKVRTKAPIIFSHDPFASFFASRFRFRPQLFAPGSFFVGKHSGDMHLYHHAFSMNSQKVRLALEEKGLDYVSHSLNPLLGKDLDVEIFQVNPNGKIPVFSTGSCVIRETLPIIQFIDSINEPLGTQGVDREKVLEWMKTVSEWSPKLFTLSHIPSKLRRYLSRFKRRVAIARMADNPDMSSKYRLKLQNVYATEDLLGDREAVDANKLQLISMLDAAERQLLSTEYLAGGSFTMADVMFIPVLARLELLSVDNEYIHSRQHLSKYWVKMKQRPTYYNVIGWYFSGLNKYKTLFTTAVKIGFRDLFKMY